MTEHDDPKLPQAFCGSATCTGTLEFSKDPIGQWVCRCSLMCSETRDGSGETPWEALAYYSHMHFGIRPEDLVIEEPHV